MAKPFFAYMLRCADGSYYVGHSDDLTRRIAEHWEGGRGGYTSKRRPLILVWSQKFSTREEAKAVEAQVKRWSRVKKEALIQHDWALLRGAARKRFPNQRSSRIPECPE